MTTVMEHPAATPVGRVVNIVRLHMANPWTTIVLPWMIIGTIFLANLAIWNLIYANTPVKDRADLAEGLQYSGGSFYIFVYMMVVAVMAMSVTFPFALGYGVTRRDFYLGSALTFVGLSAMFTIGMTILSVIEDATGGWGVGGRMFSGVYFGENWLQRAFVFFVTFLFFFFVGAVAATIWVRWKANGLIAFFVGLGILLIGGAALITLTGSWGSVGQFFATTGLLGSYAWSLVITAIAAVSGFFVLRRATPKS